MLGKCANPICLTPFRKLGTGRLFAFESRMNAKSDGVTPNSGASKKGPVFVWLCESCSLTFTLELDTEDKLTLQRIPTGARITIFDHRPLRPMG